MKKTILSFMGKLFNKTKLQQKKKTEKKKTEKKKRKKQPADCAPGDLRCPMCAYHYPNIKKCPHCNSGGNRRRSKKRSNVGRGGLLPPHPRTRRTSEDSPDFQLIPLKRLSRAKSSQHRERRTHRNKKPKTPKPRTHKPRAHKSRDKVYSDEEVAHEYDRGMKLGPQNAVIKKRSAEGIKKKRQKRSR